MERANLIKNSEAAQRLGVTPATLRKWRWQGRGPRFIRYGSGPAGRCYYAADAIDAYLAKRTVETFEDGE